MNQVLLNKTFIETSAQTEKYDWIEIHAVQYLGCAYPQNYLLSEIQIEPNVSCILTLDW